MLEPDPLLVALRVLDLRDHHVHGIDIRRRADLRDHDQVQPLAGLFDHIDHVAVHEVGVESVDPHRHGLLAPVDLVQRLDDVLAGLWLVVGGDGVLKVQEDHVRIRRGGLLEHLGGTARNGQLAAVQTRGGLRDDVERHVGLLKSGAAPALPIPDAAPPRQARKCITSRRATPGWHRRTQSPAPGSSPTASRTGSTGGISRCSR